MATSKINADVSNEGVSVNSAYGTSHLNAYRRNGVVTLSGYITITSQVPAYTNFLTIPSGFRPKGAITVYLQGDSNKWLYGADQLAIQNNSLPVGTYYLTETYVT